jgi:hypothetical protein
VIIKYNYKKVKENFHNKHWTFFFLKSNILNVYLLTLLFMLQGTRIVAFTMLGPIFNILFDFLGVKAHYGDPLWATFGSSIIVHTIWLFQKHGTFNFGHQCWFLGFTIIIFTKLMLCNIIFKIIINFIIYIERSMSMFIIYIDIIKPQSYIDYINFRASFFIKIINFNEIKKWPI